MADQVKAEHDERIKRALEADVPSIYFNGFANALSAGDIICVLERNGQPVGIINISYTVAKTLSASLATLIARLEETSKQPIMTTHEVGKSMEAASETPRKKPKQIKERKKKNV